MERPNPPTHSYGNREGGGEGREATGVLSDTATGPEIFFIRHIGGNPWRNFSRRDWKRLTPPRTPTGTGGGGREEIGVPAETATGPDKFQNLENRGELLEKIWSTGTGKVDTCLIHPIPPNHLDFLLRHTLPRKAYCQGGGSHKGKWGSRYGLPWTRSLRP